MARFHYQFKEHDNFFTPEKNRQSDKESPGPQKQNEGLLDRNKSISGSIQFKQTSSPTGSSAPSFSSEAVNSKFKVVPKSLSVRLLNCSCSGHSVNSRSGLVQEMKYNYSRKICTSPTKCSHFYRLQRFRMGCHSESGQNSRPMERKSAGLAHQYTGANGSFSCSKVVSSQLPERSHTAVFRQYNCRCLLKSSKGDKISPAFSHMQRDVVLVPRKEHPLVSSPHTRFEKSVCRPSVWLKNLPTEWMLNRAVFRQIVVIYGLPDMDIFTSAPNHQVESYVSWIEDP